MPRHLANNNLTLPFLLLIITCITFWQTLSYEFINYDDPEFINAKMVQQGLSWEGFQWSWTHVGRLNLWHPATWWSFQLDSTWGEGQSFSYRVSNLLLHAANSILIFFLAKSWLKSAPLAFLIALLFVLHPSGVQSVAWISERKGLLSSFFILASLLTWNHWLTKRKTWSYLSTILLALCATLCKPIAVVLPILLLLEQFRVQNTEDKTEIWTQWIKPYLPFFALSFLLGILTLSLHAEGGLASQGVQQSSFLERLYLLPSMVLYYLNNSFLGGDHRLLVSTPNQPLQIAIILPFLGTITVLTFWLWSLKKNSVLAILAIISAITIILPVSGVISLSHYYVADRYLYLPRAFFWISLFALLQTSFGKWFPQAQRTSWKAFGILLSILGIGYLFTTQQTVLKRYENSLSLFSYESQQDPFSVVASLQYADALSEKGRIREAIHTLQRASRYSAKSYEIHFNLALLHLNREEIKEAINHFRKATEATHVPAPDAHLNLAILLGRQNRIYELIEVTEAGITLFPNHRQLSELNQRAKKQTPQRLFK